MLTDVVKELGNRYYFSPLEKWYLKKVDEVGYTESLNYLTEIMQGSKHEVGLIINDRIEKKQINDFKQASKTIAGNGFQGLVAYALVCHQREGLLTDQIEVTLKPKRHPLINEYACIKVGDDIQKPDIDLLIYSKKAQLEKPVLIFSMKTSLRERAGQTYKWKLLMDIAAAADCQSIKNKYDLCYNAKLDFKVGLITTNFYEEITNPQQTGMLKFFDYVYITKPGEWGERVKNFSTIIEDLNKIYE